MVVKVFFSPEQRKQWDILFKMALELCYRFMVEKDDRAEQTWKALAMIRADTLGVKPKQAANKMKSLIEEGLNANPTQNNNGTDGDSDSVPGVEKGIKEKPE